MTKGLAKKNQAFFHLVGIFCFLSITSTGDTQSIYKFLTVALQYGIWDPWNSAKIADIAWAMGDPGPFVYPFGMYLMLLPARAITFAFGFDSINYSPIGASILNLELTIFIYLCSVYLDKIIQHINPEVKISSKYYLLYSPMIAVSFYFGRQFDIIPTTITVIVVYQILRFNFMKAGLLIGIGVSIKSYPALMIIPVLIYVFVLSTNFRHFLSRATAIVGPALGVPIFGTLIFYSESYSESVLQNPSLKRLFWFTLYLGGNWSPILLFPAVCAMLIIFQFTLGKKMNEMGLVGLVAIYFLIPCVLASPMVMWWTWAAPFLLAYAVLEMQRNREVTQPLLTLILALGLINVTYSLYDNWSYLTQIATWYKSPWPLPISPQAFVASIAGSEIAELMRAVLFSIQWGLAVSLIVLVIRRIYNSDQKMKVE